MSLKRKQQGDEIAALIERGAAELRASNPELLAEPQPLSDEIIDELLRDDREALIPAIPRPRRLRRF